MSEIKTFNFYDRAEKKTPPFDANSNSPTECGCPRWKSIQAKSERRLPITNTIYHFAPTQTRELQNAHFIGMLSVRIWRQSKRHSCNMHAWTHLRGRAHPPNPKSLRFSGTSVNPPCGRQRICPPPSEYHRFNRIPLWASIPSIRGFCRRCSTR